VTTTDVGVRIERARRAAGLSQRALADMTGISQPTLSRVISGQRTAKMPELMAIAWATGVTVAELAGTGTVADRVECAARATNHADMDGMRQELLHFLELDDYLSDQAIPATVLSGGNVDRGNRGQRICCAIPSGTSTRSAAARRSCCGHRAGNRD
jgi:transcriptional regulator with XRE-family HTH domain